MDIKKIKETLKAEKAVTVNGVTISIEFDDFPINPRVLSEPLGTIITTNNRYYVGEETFDDNEDFENRNDIITLPVYMYVHGAIALNTTGFSCPLDSGQVGFIYVTKDTVMKVFNVDCITEELLEKVYDILKYEIEELNAYIQGDAFTIIVNDSLNEEVVDNVIGYENALEAAIEEACYYL